MGWNFDVTPVDMGIYYQQKGLAPLAQQDRATDF
jgi:hypothetical protein